MEFKIARNCREYFTPENGFEDPLLKTDCENGYVINNVIPDRAKCSRQVFFLRKLL